MKTVNELNTVITDFSGDVIKHPRGFDLTVREALVTILSSSRQEFADVFVAQTVAGKIHSNGDGSIELEDYEFGLLRSACRTNQPGFVAPVIASLMKALGETEETAKR